ncbi:MAG TPA: rod shape-determining protein [Frankiaceae bacterium]|nr:rod shape-determining protein [Frankiaceae bacterium]
MPVAVDLGSSRVRVWSPRRGRVLDAPAAGIRNGRVVGDVACLAVLRRQLDLLGCRRVDVTVAVPALLSAADAVRRVLAAAGARHVTEVEQSLAAAIGAGVAVASSRPALVIDVGAGLVEVAVVSDGTIRAQRVLEWGVGDLATTLRRRIHVASSVWVTAPEAARAFDGRAVAGIHTGTGEPIAMPVPRGHLDAVLAPAVEQVRRAVDEVVAELPARYAADVTTSRPVVVGGGATASLLRERLSAALGVPVATPRSPGAAVLNGLAAVVPYARVVRTPVAR